LKVCAGCCFSHSSGLIESPRWLSDSHATVRQ
jgi:hypothetical protein